ncbi:MAG: Membrane protein insertase YidC [Catillopecten margaritatus gill symbiont]|uniref:Membrane protein insertase YidC n=1 Tax=Catillopecten margaritatus gill symbiont TaxID=3083288 RepID=A0AAU6PFZ7_9GAMM
MDLLFYIFIYPIEWLMQSILSGFYSLFGNYGISIIFLSIVINILILPLYYLAEFFKTQHQIHLSQLQPKIDFIKNNYQGQEQHSYLNALYKVYNYSPISSVKASLGLLLQIPFFFAAFHLLGNYTAFEGVSFGFITDLNQPDNLLFGQNLLPILMTLVNLFSAYFYAKNMSKSDTYQLWGLAGIFLVLLYFESAALLLYWTINNLFSLGKNWFEQRFDIAVFKSKLVNFLKTKFTRYSKNIESHANYLYSKIALLGWALFALIITTLLLIYLYVNTDDYEGMGLRMTYFIGVLVALTYFNFILILKNIIIDKRNVIFKAVILLLSVVVIALIYRFIKLEFIDEFNFKRGPLFAISLLLITVLLSLNALHKIKFIRNFQATPNIAFLIFAPLLLLVFLVNPVSLHFGGGEFDLTKEAFISFIASVFLVCSMTVFIVYKFSNTVFKTFLLFLGFYLLIVFGFYSFVDGKDYGLLDHFKFQAPDKLESSKYATFTEIFLLTLLAFFSVFSLSKYQQAIRKILTLVLSVLLLFVMINLSNMPEQEKNYNDRAQNIENTPVELPKNEINTTLAMSKEKNVLVFFLDAFSGIEMNKAFNEKAIFLDEYTGFTWYKNTLSTGSHTALSIAALLGGQNYTMDKMWERNIRDRQSYRDEIDKAYTIYPKVFIPNGWEFLHFAPEYVKKPHKEVNTVNMGLYRDYYLSQHDIKRPERTDALGRDMLFATGLFRISPRFLKKIIYDDGEWLGLYKSQDALFGNINKGATHWGFLNTFKNKLNASNSKKTFKFFHLLLPHAPYVVAKDGSLDPSKSSYSISAQKSLEIISKIIRKLKDKGVYNQTKIVLISDHGYHHYESKTPEFEKGFNNKTTVRAGAMYPLLLVKDFNTKGQLKSSGRFMSNIDLAGIVCATLESGCDIKDIDHTKINTNRILRSNPDAGKGQYATFEVKDNIFEIKNWKKIRQNAMP